MIDQHDLETKLLIRNNPDEFKAWVDEGNNPYAVDELGETFLHRAATFGATRIMKLLLELELDPNVPDLKEENPPFAYAFTAEPVILLRRYGASLTFENNEGLSPLHNAACQGRTEVVSTLLALGADMYAPCTGSAYPAVFESFILAEHTVSTLATFAAAGFDMKGKDGGWTLLHKAVNERHHEARDFLLDLGADPSFKDDEGCNVAPINGAK